ncbi:plasmid pRiA4b ORF-3 family protein [Mangrovimonas sp. AS39]|uniref:IS1096 element passenger TnpR family protein n=1 Tax=Mangrovimonas TaxID=1211036 RepID=UPI0006B53521|nr:MULTISPECIES: plasmid pRiA4b ORF-3 family protein [Mangrovimonas]MCF1192173.1 plasmid pRiA4b ORF-3 family protein [Mangrovimonas futianensis]MCF1195867.1 plasmid pRiA4b ORF-3 family protein [Mangrovimonas futianensis]MCF1422172.1 plasmid pRiA4b ORF-3 family protein [Mangrovimonas futianensis]
MIYRFRVILDNDTEDDIFRDIEIRENDTLEDFHNTITQSFGFDGSEMASFYVSNDEWEQGEEISLFDISDEANARLMNETTLNDVVHEAQTRLIYIYDFFSMWTFLVELAEIVEEAEGTDYPNLMFVHGQIPDEAPERSFEADDLDEFNDEFDDDYDIDDYESLDFDENWN